LKRLENARKELEESDKYDHIVVNDDLKRASEELAEIIAFYRDKRKRNTFSPGGDS
jgi:guanylate kinase